MGCNLISSFYIILNASVNHLVSINYSRIVVYDYYIVLF